MSPTSIKVNNGCNTSFCENKLTSHSWDIQFTRNLNDWEMATQTEFYNQLKEFKGIQEGVDRLWWKEDSMGIL